MKQIDLKKDALLKEKKKKIFFHNAVFQIILN